MKKIENVLLIFFKLAVLTTVIITVRYFLADEPLWESPYDQKLIEQKIVFDLPQDNLYLLLLHVGEYVEKWTGEQSLISCNINIDNTSANRRCHLVYDIGNVNDYIGVCEVVCCFKDEKWVMENAEKKYTQDEYTKIAAMHIQAVQEKYEDSIIIMRDNVFWKGTDCLLSIKADRVNVIVFGKNAKNERCIVQRISLL